MKQKMMVSTMFIATLFLLIGSHAHSQSEMNEDKTLSPYFFVKSDNPELDQLPLQSTSAKVNISGVIADVIVTQIYKNEGKRPLEAIYIFPSSTRAGVYGMRMTIGERIITAKIKAREQARQEYEQAKQEGRSASLLEQQRPNVFQMNVANILPGDTIKVELSYTEFLIPTDGIYEFVYPTVVGPRYSNQNAANAPANDKWVANPYLHEGEKAPYTFNIITNISTGMEIKEITCPSHKVNINYDGPAIAIIKLDETEKSGGKRDYILKYRLAGGQIESGLLLYEGEEENFFLMMVQPPKRIKVKQIPLREYIFIVDVSGSMNGFPLETSKKLLHDLISNLRPTDTFNVLLFAGGSTVMSEKSVQATKENIQKTIDLIDRQRGGGGTELLLALKRGLSLPKTEGASRTIVIATDGYVNVEVEAFDLIRNNLNKANVFTFGIGSSVNRFIIEGMARVGAGEPFVITKPEYASAAAEKFRKYIQSPVLTQIEVDFGKFGVYDVTPSSIPDVMAERPVTIFGKWRGKPHGQVHLKGISGDGTFTEKIDISSVTPLKTNAALRYLWARHRIAILSDYNMLTRDNERIKEVTNLGLSYNLLTAYTSFVAIDTQVRNEDGKATTINQPLPLPQGVSNLAVGRISARQKSSLSLGSSQFLMAPEGRLTSDKFALESPKPPVEEPNLSKPSLEKYDVKIGKIVVTEGLSEASVKDLLKTHLQSIKDCVNQLLNKRSILNEVLLILNVDLNGKVTKVELDKPKTGNNSFEQCILKEFRQLQFPSPRSGKNAKITVKLIIK